MSLCSPRSSADCYHFRWTFPGVPKMRRPFLLTAVALLAACASTSLQNEWRAEEDSGPALRKVLVIGVAKREDVRRTFEDGFVAALKARGVNAVASHSTVLETDPEASEKVREAVKATGADGILMTRLVKVDKQTQTTTVGQPMVMPMHYNMYGYYPKMWLGAYGPPMTVSYDVAILETRVFRAASEKLVWVGGTETFAPSSNVREETEAFAKVIIEALAKAKLL